MSQSERNRLVLIANETLYQLSYTPAVTCENYHNAKTYQQEKKIQAASVWQTEADGQAPR
jgi:hypothetical protein